MLKKFLMVGRHVVMVQRFVTFWLLRTPH